MLPIRNIRVRRVITRKVLWISAMFAVGSAVIWATTTGIVELSCAVCGAKNEYRLLRTVSLNGYELDMRPSGTGSLLSLTVKQCQQQCFYELSGKSGFIARHHNIPFR